MTPGSMPAAGADLGRYTIEATLGEGGMAVVYRVRHRELGSSHALKMLHRADPMLCQRLLQEGRVQANLRHPNIVAVTDVLDLAGSPGLVMELIDGPNLQDLIRSRPLAWDEVDRLAQGILRGVAAAHRSGFVHRDLKPANILVADQDGELVPKVADFGLAKALAEAAPSPGKTRTGVTMGTPAYMAPEQVRDAKHVDYRADIWSLGVILYELVTATRAFPQQDILEILNAVCEARFPPLLEVRPDAPPRMARAVAAAIRIDPELRVADCEALLDLWLDRVRARPAPAGPLAGAAGAVGAGAGRSAATMTSGPYLPAPSAATFDFAASQPPGDSIVSAATPAAATPAAARRGAGRVIAGVSVVAAGLAALVYVATTAPAILEPPVEAGHTAEAPADAALELGPGALTGAAPELAGAPAPLPAQPDAPAAPVPASAPTDVAALTAKPTPSTATPTGSTATPTGSTAKPNGSTAKPNGSTAKPTPSTATPTGAADPALATSDPAANGSGAATEPPPTELDITLKSYPIGARVTLYGRTICTTPCSARVPVGSHLAEFTLEDGRTAMEVIQVSPTSTTFGHRF